MSKPKKPLNPDFNNKVCINHLRLYQFDIKFTKKMGISIINDYNNEDVTDEDLVVQLRGYITSQVLSLCKLREIISFIERSGKIKFNTDTEKYAKKFLEDSKHLVDFRNHYIAHPLKNDHKEKREYLLPIPEIRPYILRFFNINEPKIENKILIQKLGEQSDQLERILILIDHIVNCIPNKD